MGVGKRPPPSKGYAVSKNPQNRIILARLLRILILTLKYQYENKNPNREVPKNVLDKIIQECIKQKSELHKITEHPSLTKEVIFEKIKPIALKVQEKISIENAIERFNGLIL